MILITGAGGKTGRALIQALSRVESLSAFVHRQEYVSIVKSLGAEQVLVGDMRDDFCHPFGDAGGESSLSCVPQYESR